MHIGLCAGGFDDACESTDVVGVRVRQNHMFEVRRRSSNGFNRIKDRLLASWKSRIDQGKAIGRLDEVHIDQPRDDIEAITDLFYRHGPDLEAVYVRDEPMKYGTDPDRVESAMRCRAVLYNRALSGRGL